MPIAETPARCAPHTRIAIIGSMGSGKSTVAALVADRLGVELVDSDVWIETTYGTTGAVVAARDGVEELHRIEAQLLVDTIASTEAAVIAPAASVVDAPEARQALTSLPVVAWLDVEPIVGFERARRGSHRRSLSLEEYERLDERRRVRFAEVATLRLAAERSPSELADEILDACRGEA